MLPGDIHNAMCQSPDAQSTRRGIHDKVPNLAANQVYSEYSGRARCIPGLCTASAISRVQRKVPDRSGKDGEHVTRAANRARPLFPGMCHQRGQAGHSKGQEGNGPMEKGMKT